MRPCWLLSIPVSCCLFVSGLFAAELPWEQKLPFKEAAIHYTLKGSQEGTETLYIKDYGTLRAKYHKAMMKVMGTSSSTETLELTDPDWVTTYNLTQKKGEKITNPKKIYQAEYAKLSAEEKAQFQKNAQAFGASMMGRHGGSVQPKAGKLLGYDYDLSRMGNSTVAMLLGTDIPLKTETSMMGMTHTLEATKIDTTGPVQDKVFAPPAGIAAPVNPEMEAMMAQTIRQTVDQLKRPGGAQAMQQQLPPMVPGMMPGGDGEKAPSSQEQQEMMQQMQEAMKAMKKMPAPR